jgi:protein-S-isoprenylcysteine O-methyltransferase Ste14
MLFRWLLAVILLPGTVLFIIPLCLGGFTKSAIDPFSLGTGIVIGMTGLALSMWSAFSFILHGKGTAAPWDPPKTFVTAGPYKYVRNPMILGVFIMLLSETIIFKSWILLVWLTFFIGINLIYVRLQEEKGLKKRFDGEYEDYMETVPRWIPLLFSKRDNGPGR